MSITPPTPAPLHMSRGQSAAEALHRPVIDLTRRQFVHEREDFVIYGTWYGPTADQAEPCLVIVNKFRTGPQKPAVILLSNAHRWVNEGGWSAGTAMDMLDKLGRKPSMTRTQAFVEMIHDHLDELIKMPPCPSDRELVVADAIAVVDGKETRAEIVHRL